MVGSSATGRRRGRRRSSPKVTAQSGAARATRARGKSTLGAGIAHALRAVMKRVGVWSVALGCAGWVFVVGCSGNATRSKGNDPDATIGGSAGSAGSQPLGGAGAMTGGQAHGGVAGAVQVSGGAGNGPIGGSTFVPVGADGCPLSYPVEGSRCVPPNTPDGKCGAAAVCRTPNFIASGNLTSCIGGIWDTDGTERFCSCSDPDLIDTPACASGSAGGQGGEPAGGAGGDSP